ncbi:MAG TPA: phosphotransacetylase [Candidatus Nanoarchaeia archaeon]|nr:phosphotransacetylase [Candidatus Nanoarchaeia archaeon]
MAFEMSKENVRKKKVKIVFVDNDHRIYAAAQIILDQKLGCIVFVGKKENIPQSLIDNPVVAVVDPLSSDKLKLFAEQYYNLRKSKGISLDDALRVMQQPVFFGAMLVMQGFADGLVAGLSAATKPFLPVFHLKCLESGVRKVSSFFIMEKGEQCFLFADCAVQPDPSAAELAEIGVLTAASARLLGISPKVAFLSYSTLGSAVHPLVKKVQEAVVLAKIRDATLPIEGEVQLDAALVPTVAVLKNAGAGDANVLIFPDLNVGNICYKALERLGGFSAVGPILQGLVKPMNDLSRGASVADIVKVFCITALQVKE